MRCSQSMHLVRKLSKRQKSKSEPAPAASSNEGAENSADQELAQPVTDTDTETNIESE